MGSVSQVRVPPPGWCQLGLRSRLVRYSWCHRRGSSALAAVDLSRACRCDRCVKAPAGTAACRRTRVAWAASCQRHGTQRAQDVTLLDKKHSSGARPMQQQGQLHGPLTAPNSLR